MENHQDSTLRDALDLLRRGLLLALVVGITMAIIALLISQSLTETYTTETTLLATASPSTVQGIDLSLVTPPPIDAFAYRAAALSKPVLQEAAEIAGVPGLFGQVQIEVSVEEDRLSSLVNISAQGTDPELVATASDALAQALINWDQRRASRLVESTITRISAQVDELDNEIQILTERDLPTEARQLERLLALRSDRQYELSIVRSFADSSVAAIEVVEPAPVPFSPTGPKPLRNALIAFALGLFISYALTSLRNALDTRIKTSEDLARVSNLSVMSELPKRNVRTKAILQEAISYLHTNILFAAPNKPKRVILMTSGRNTEDKSTIALNLAKSFARSEKNVLLIDADLRSPAIASSLDITDTSYPSLQLYLESPDEPLQPVPLYMDLSHQLEVIPSFQPASSPTELLRSGFRECLERWKAMYDVIIIDSAPLLSVADSLTIAPLCDTLLFSVNVQDTDLKEIEAAVDLLGRSNVPVVGLVATEVDELSKGEVYGYSPAYLSGKETAIVPTNFGKIPRRQT